MDDSISTEASTRSTAGRLGLAGILCAASPFVLNFRINDFQSAHVCGLLAVLLGIIALIAATRDPPEVKKRSLALGAGSLAFGLFWVGRMLGYL